MPRSTRVHLSDLWILNTFCNSRECRIKTNTYILYFIPLSFTGFSKITDLKCPQHFGVLVLGTTFLQDAPSPSPRTPIAQQYIVHFTYIAYSEIPINPVCVFLLWEHLHSDVPIGNRLFCKRPVMITFHLEGKRKISSIKIYSASGLKSNTTEFYTALKHVKKICWDRSQGQMRINTQQKWSIYVLLKSGVIMGKEWKLLDSL